jgi:hypothetical protein
VVVIVVVVLLLAGGAIAAYMLNPGLQRRLTPTDAIVRQILDRRGGETAELWETLEQRDLSDEQRTRMVEGLLDKRQAKGSLSPYDDKWMTAQLETLSPEMKDRYYRGMMSARVLTPRGTMTAGQPTRVGVEFRDHQRVLPDRKLMALVEGLYVGDSAEPLGRTDKAVDLKKLPRQRQVVAAFTPEEAGPLTVRVAFWHLYAPPEVEQQTIVWADDGTPTLPGAVIWSTRVELEETLDIQ